MPNWLKPKLLERPDTEKIDQLCTLASQDCNKGDV